MMTKLWSVLVFFITFFESVILEDLSASSDERELPLTKSLGVSLKRSLVDNLDDHLSQEFYDQYKEMRRASDESFQNFHVHEKRLRRVIIDEDELELPKEGTGEFKIRRRSATKLQSAVGKRRARSQVSRRDKLNNQGLRSHQHHSKRGSRDFTNG